MLIDLIKANRSCRGYDRSRKVTMEELWEMVDCARLSATGGNFQPLKYYITNDPQETALLNQLTNAIKKSFTGFLISRNNIAHYNPASQIVCPLQTNISIVINDIFLKRHCN